MAEMPDWLVQTKIQPPLLHTDIIERHRLLEALRSAVTSRPVTLISAPAGYGKTTLIASLPRLMPNLRLAWLSVDSEDNDPARFLGGLIGALQRLHPALGEGARQHLATDLRRAVAQLINDVMQYVPEPFALVLDDLHFVTEPRVHGALDYLIERLPPQMRLVIATRHDPPLALARLIARRQMAEVRRPHLSFTPDEVRRLLNDTLGLRLGPEELGALMTRTEGWAAGLCLVASSLERISTEAGRTSLLTGLVSTDSYVFDFLAAEVLNLQEAETRQFLLQTSILAELTPALCAAVTGRPEAGRLLAELYRKNLFLAADEAGAYRYHALFAEFLQRQLALEAPDLVPELHRRAALAQPSPTRAVAHLLAAGSFEAAGGEMERAGDLLLMMGLSDTLRTWGRQLPEPVRNAHPRLCFQLGRAALNLADHGGAFALLDVAHAGFAASGNTGGQAVALTTLAAVTMMTGDLGKCRELMARFNLLPGLPPAVRARGAAMDLYLCVHDRNWAAAEGALRRSYTLTAESGDLAAAEGILYRYGLWIPPLPGCLDPLEEFRAWVEERVPAENSALRLVLENLGAVTELMRGRLDSAAARARAALALKERIGGFGWLGLASAVCLAAVATARGQQDEAEAMADLLLGALDVAAPDQIQLWLYVPARTYWLLGRPAETRQILQRMQEPAARRGFPIGPALQRRLAGLLALSGRRPGEAESAFREAVALEEEVPIAMAPGSARVLLIRALTDQQRNQAALKELQELMEICEERQIWGLLLQEGVLILPLLNQAAALPDRTGDLARTALALLGQAVPPAARPRAGALPEPLTDRELVVLRLLGAGATNREIAAALIIGEETAKTHVARILRKLNAPTRSEAAARGRELGLL